MNHQQYDLKFSVQRADHKKRAEKNGAGPYFFMANKQTGVTLGFFVHPCGKMGSYKWGYNPHKWNSNAWHNPYKCSYVTLHL